MKSVDLEHDLADCSAAHDRVMAAVQSLTDHGARRPSLLPRWTVGHVITHLARNADSHVRMLLGAERGDVAHQYDGGATSRAADIEAGAERDAAALVADLHDSTARLEHTWAITTDTGWQGRGMTMGGELAALDLPYRRWVETEIHHIDLDVGYSFADLPPAFIGRELRRLTSSWASRQPMGLAALPQGALDLAPDERLAWLVGRLDVAGLASAGVFG